MNHGKGQVTCVWSMNHGMGQVTCVWSMDHEMGQVICWSGQYVHYRDVNFIATKKMN